MEKKTAPTYAELMTMAGQELGLSEWVIIDQGRINQFAECTGDRQWVHVDPVRARRESPFRKPIAHGKLILSMVSALGQEINAIPENTQGVINRGLNDVKFLAPVPVDSRIRLRSQLISMNNVGPGQYLTRVFNTIEVEGNPTPALTCETVSMFYERRAKHTG